MPRKIVLSVKNCEAIGSISGSKKLLLRVMNEPGLVFIGIPRIDEKQVVL